MKSFECTRMGYISMFVILLVFVIILIICYCKQKSEESYYNTILKIQESLPPQINMKDPLKMPWVMESANESSY